MLCGFKERWLAIGELVVGGKCADLEEGVGAAFAGAVGTVWKARVTSDAVIRDGGATGPGSGGGEPPSDFTSCRVKGTAVRSSAMIFKLFTAGRGSLLVGCDHTALRCSGSGTRAGDFAHAEAEGCGGGVFGCAGTDDIDL